MSVGACTGAAVEAPKRFWAAWGLGASEPPKRFWVGVGIGWFEADMAPNSAGLGYEIVKGLGVPKLIEMLGCVVAGAVYPNMLAPAGFGGAVYPNRLGCAVAGAGAVADNPNKLAPAGWAVAGAVGD